MTDEERRARMIERNAAICTLYSGGATVAALGRQFKLKRQRICQILQQAGVWRPYVKGNRSKFLGVSVTAETKDALKAEADKRGVSTSKLTSDILNEALK